MKILAATALGAALMLGLGAEAQAAIALQPVPTDAPIVRAFAGCGPYGHRGPLGGCRAGGQWGGYRPGSCPRGWHVGPYGRKCWPNRY